MCQSHTLWCSATLVVSDIGHKSGCSTPLVVSCSVRVLDGHKSGCGSCDTPEVWQSHLLCGVLAPVVVSECRSSTNEPWSQEWVWQL